jgi:hypothetical protein
MDRFEDRRQAGPPAGILRRSTGQYLIVKTETAALRDLFQ